MIGAAEFLYDPTRIQLFLINPVGPSARRISDKLEESTEWQPVLCESPLEAVKLVRQMETCVIYGYVDTPDALLHFLNMFRLIAPLIEQSMVRVIISHTQELAQIAPVERLRYSGAYELLPEPIQERSLLFKLDRAMKSLPSREMEMDDGSEESLARKLSRQKRVAGRVPGTTSRQPKIREVAPLELESDCWLTLHGGAKKISDRWTIRLTGPGPAMGRWAEIDSHVAGERAWQWVPVNPSNDPFIKEEGAWVFVGSRIPEYHNDLWWFVGATPALDFYYEGQSFGAKLRVDDLDTLLVAKDSEAAKAALAAIMSTRDRLVRSIQTTAPLQTERKKREPDVEITEMVSTFPDMVTGEAPSTVRGSGKAVSDADMLELEFEKALNPGTDGGSPFEVSHQIAAAAAETTMLATHRARVAAAGAEEPETDEPVVARPDRRASIVAAAFLASELLRKRELEPGEMAHRFCEFISGTLGGVKVELWLRSAPGQPWVCAGTENRKPGRLAAEIKDTPDTGSQQPDLLIGAVFEVGDSRAGRLAFKGERIGEVPLDYAFQLGTPVTGILRSFN